MANRPLLYLIAILAGRIYSHHGVPHKQVLVQWSHSQQEDATWEDLLPFANLYGISDLEDKVNFKEGSSDSIERKEVLIDTEPIQQLMKEWAEPINQSNQEGMEPRRRNKPS